MISLPVPSFEQKIIDSFRLPEIVNQAVRPLVFTNGCFDIVHRGHVTYLAQAKTLGSTLCVALNTDESVRRLGKGDDRPINTLDNRLAVIASLESVDFVTWFDEDTPLNLIEILKPDVLVKGGDWQPENIVGAKETIARGGKVFAIAFEHQTSTTALLEKIRK